jgi:hypothetical protein
MPFPKFNPNALGASAPEEPSFFKRMTDGFNEMIKPSDPTLDATPEEARLKGFGEGAFEGVKKLFKLAPAATRATSGVLAAEGGLTGAGIAGVGETLAEGLEGEFDPKRIGTEAGLGAVPFGAVFKAGRPLASAARGAAFAGAGSALRQGINGKGSFTENIDPLTVAGHAAFGGAVGGGLARLLGGSAKAEAAAEKPVFEVEPTAQEGGRVFQSKGKLGPVKAPRPIRGSGEDIDIDLPTPTYDAPEKVPYLADGLSGRSQKVAQKEIVDKTREQIRDQKNLSAVERWLAGKRATEGKLEDQFSTALSKKTAAMDEADIAAAKIADAKAGLEPQDPTVSESYSRKIPGGRETVSQKFKAPGEEEAAGGAMPDTFSHKWSEDEDELASAMGDLEPIEDTRSGLNKLRGFLTGMQERGVPLEPSFGKVPPAGTPAGEIYQQWIAKGLDEKAALKMAARGRPPVEPPIPGETVPQAPSAKYIGEQEGLGPQYDIQGGDLDKSTVGAEKLKELGIEVPPSTMAPSGAAQRENDALAALLGTPSMQKFEPQVEQAAPQAVESQVDKLNFFKTRQGASGQNYRQAKQAFTEGEIPSDVFNDTIRAGHMATGKPKTWSPASAQQMSEGVKAEQAAPLVEPTPTPARLSPETPTETPADAPDWVKEQMSFLDRIKKLGSEDQGSIDPAFATRLGLGAGGAVIGGATDRENPIRGATIGAIGGFSLPSAISALQQVGAHPSVIDNLGESLSSEGVKATASKIFRTLPQIQRFNYLADATGLGANAVAGPYGSAIMGALEHGLSGDPRGWEALKSLRPDTFLKVFQESFAEARSLIGRAEGSSLEAAPTQFEKVMATPGTYMTAGDVAARKFLEEAGFSGDEARRITLTSEPELPFFKGLAETGKNSPLMQMLFPFRRTPANIGEQGAQRIPGLGFGVQQARANQGFEVDPFKQQLVQQGLGAAVGAGSAALGANVDPETGKVVKKFVKNMAGQYSLPATIGYAAGEAMQKGKPAALAGASAAINDLPLPTTDTLTDWAKFIFGGQSDKTLLEQLPRGVVPAQLREIITPSTGSATLAPLPSAWRQK